MNLCSKCYRDFRIKEEQAASAKVAVEKSLNLRSKTAAVESAVPAEPPLVPISSSSLELSGSSSAPVFGADQPQPKAAIRCLSCNRKCTLTGFRCKCGNTYCGTHRYPEKHECTYDFKAAGRDSIAKANPVVKADKVDRF